jgi:uncharacterized protein with NRDE domain
MCLVIVGWQQHPEFPLIIAGNRDEFHGRPTEAAHWWPDQPDILGGRDLQAGGTWLALHRNGRFATVTNYRDKEPTSAKNRSRGHLVTEFLQGSETSDSYLRSVDGAKYAGFNLLVFDGGSLGWSSNRGDDIKLLPPGVYGLSNALLDSPWHKVLRAKSALEAAIADDNVNASALFRLLGDREKAPVSQVDSARLPFETAHAISAPFIVLPDYGTRSSNVALYDAGGNWQVRERRFDASGARTGESAFRFDKSK